jgi:hypothetical protein
LPAIRIEVESGAGQRRWAEALEMSQAAGATRECLLLSASRAKRRRTFLPRLGEQ